MSPLHKLMLKGGIDTMDKKNINQTVGANIKRERERAGYTQERFSELIGMGPKSLSAVERGTVGISLSALRRVCTALSVSGDALLFGETPKHRGTELMDKLDRLGPKEYEIASAILHKVLEAFTLDRNIPQEKGCDRS